MRALEILFLARAFILFQAHPPGRFELIIAPLIERQLGAFEMQDLARHPVQQAPVMADDQDGAVITTEVILQPEGCFEVEMVCRFIKQQQIGLGEQQ